MRTAQRSQPRPLKRSLVAGALLALLVLATGAAFAATQQTTFTAESVLVVLPRADLDEATTAAFYETMSRGQIVGTFAEVANNASFQNQAMDNLGITGRQRTEVSTEVSVVPATSVILVRTTAGTAAVAERVADGSAGLTTTYLSGLSDAYRAQVVHQAAGSALSSGMSPTMLLVLAAVVAAALGLVVQQALYHLASPRPPTAAGSPAVEQPASEELPSALSRAGDSLTPVDSATPATPAEQPAPAGHR